MGRPPAYDWPAILEWIRATYQTTGWPVTVRQVMKQWEISATSVVDFHVRAWVRMGLLEQQGGGKRGYKPPHKEIIL